MVQTFWPVTTHSSPSRTARVFSEARSEPEPGSEKPWHQISSADRIGGEEALLLLLGAVGDDRRPAHREAEHVGHLRRAGARDLLVEDRLLDERGARAAVLGRPAQAGPAALVQRPLPGAPELECVRVAGGLAAGMVVLYPAADGVTKLPLDWRQRQVHGPRTLPARAGRAGAPGRERDAAEDQREAADRRRRVIGSSRKTAP